MLHNMEVLSEYIVALALLDPEIQAFIQTDVIISTLLLIYDTKTLRLTIE